MKWSLLETNNLSSLNSREHITNVVFFSIVPCLWRFFPLHCHCLHHDEAFALSKLTHINISQTQNNKQLLPSNLKINPKHVNAM